jgi:drug/metabolite transporter (DMT)-like permease
LKLLAAPWRVQARLRLFPDHCITRATIRYVAAFRRDPAVSPAASSRQRSERAGITFALLCALNGAFVPGFAKLTTTALTGLAAAVFATFFAALAALALVAAKGEMRRLLDPKTAPRLAAMGLLGTGVAFFLFFEGAKRTSAIETALCMQIEPAYSLLLTRIVLGHPITLRRLAAVATILAGIAFALEARVASGLLGPALLLATPLAWQASHLVALRGLPEVHARVFSAARYTVGFAALAAVWLLRGGPSELPAWSELAPMMPLLALQGVVLSFVGTLLWYETIARLDLLRSTAIVVPSIPLLSLGASFLLVGEVPSVRQAIGMLLAVAGVLAFVTARDAAGGSAARAPAPSTDLAA